MAMLILNERLRLEVDSDDIATLEIDSPGKEELQAMFDAQSIRGPLKCRGIEFEQVVETKFTNGPIGFAKAMVRGALKPPLPA